MWAVKGPCPQQEQQVFHLLKREDALKTELFLLLQFTANVAQRLSHDLRHPGNNPASLTVKHKELRMGGFNAPPLPA